jgi:hypothetical protein
MERETHTLVLDTVADTGRGQGATRSLKFWVYPPGPRRPPGFLGFKKNQNCDKLDFDPTDPRIFWEPPPILNLRSCMVYMLYGLGVQ